MMKNNPNRKGSLPKNSAQFHRRERSFIRQTDDRHFNRRGAVTVALVLAVTILGSILMAQGVRRVLAERRLSEVYTQRQQAQQLLQLGIAKAAELSQSGNLTSGSWKIAAGILHPKDPARIDFDVSDDEVTVTAFFPDHPDRFLLVTETIPHPENSDPARQP